jgi:hypothetical protein
MTGALSLDPAQGSVTGSDDSWAVRARRRREGEIAAGADGVIMGAAFNSSI